MKIQNNKIQKIINLSKGHQLHDVQITNEMHYFIKRCLENWESGAAELGLFTTEDYEEFYKSTSKRMMFLLLQHFSIVLSADTDNMKFLQREKLILIANGIK